MSDAVFQGTISGFKTIGGRKVCAITIECPIEYQAKIAAIAEHGTWVAVARIKPPDEKPVESKRFHELPVGQQAAMRCKEKAFWSFLEERNNLNIRIYNEEDARNWLCEAFGVTSRKDIPKAEWENVNSLYELWCVASAMNGHEAQR